MSSRGITMQTEEGIERKIKKDRDTSNKGESGSHHKNRNLSSKSKV